MVGVFGILAYSVQQRVRDFGVRRALGATTSDVLRLVMANAARVIAAGVVIGLALSAASGRLLETHAVRRAAAGSCDVRGGDDGARDHRRAVDRRARLAGGAHRSGRRSS